MNPSPLLSNGTAAQAWKPRIAVAGVGAMGSTLAAALARSGHRPTLVARGARRAQLQAQGLRHADDDGAVTAHRLPTSLPADLGEQDVIFVTAKSGDVPALLAAIAFAITPRTTLVPLVNGVPWWYGLGGRGEGPIDAVDPGGELAARYPAEQIVGCIGFLTARIDVDGVGHSSGPRRLVIGDVDDVPRKRTRAIAAMLDQGGIGCVVETALRPALWSKIALNLATNPLSVVSGATLIEQHDDRGLRHAVVAVLRETCALAQALGNPPTLNEAQMLEAMRRAGPFRTSMLQDLDAGRVLELGSIGFACLELADRVGVAMPAARLLCELAAARARVRPT